jgi:hypothetical protein
LTSALRYIQRFSTLGQDPWGVLKRSQEIVMHAKHYPHGGKYLSCLIFKMLMIK